MLPLRGRAPSPFDNSVEELSVEDFFEIFFAIFGGSFPCFFTNPMRTHSDPAWSLPAAVSHGASSVPSDWPDSGRAPPGRVATCYRDRLCSSHVTTRSMLRSPQHLPSPILTFATKKLSRRMQPPSAVCSVSSNRAVMVTTRMIYDSGPGRPGFEPCLG